MKKIILILFSSSLMATDYNYFVDLVQNKCRLENTLIIKKSYLSLIREPKDCSNRFIKNLIASCSELSCDELNKYFFISQNSDSGNVIGGSK